MTKPKFTIGFSVTFALICTIATWIVLGESSPLQGYFLDHAALPNLLRRLTVFPYIAMLIVNADTEFGDLFVATATEFIQWLMLGFLLALFISFVRSRRRTNTTK